MSIGNGMSNDNYFSRFPAQASMPFLMSFCKPFSIFQRQVFKEFYEVGELFFSHLCIVSTTYEIYPDPGETRFVIKL